MPSLNDRYEEMGYDSTSVLINLNSLMMTIVNGAATWVIVFGIKAFVFTLRGNVEAFEHELNEMEDQTDFSNFRPKTKTNKTNHQSLTKKELNKKKLK